MMENHIYDNYLGMLGRGPGDQPRGDGFTIGSDGHPTAANPAPGGNLQHAFRMPTTCQLPGKPSQEWEQAHIQFNGGRNDGFVKSDSGPVAMGYWTGEDLPWAYSLAATFPVADRWFAPILGQTQPNRRYLLAATSVGMVDDILPENAIPAPEGTILDRLVAHQIPWRNYYSSFPPTSCVFPGEAIEGHASLVKIGQFFADAKTGNLPAFAIIDPDFGHSSGENPQNIVHAEVFAASSCRPSWTRRPGRTRCWYGPSMRAAATTTTCRHPRRSRPTTSRRSSRPCMTGSPGTDSGSRRSWCPRGAGQIT